MGALLSIPKELRLAPFFPQDCKGDIQPVALKVRCLSVLLKAELLIQIVTDDLCGAADHQVRLGRILDFAKTAYPGAELHIRSCRARRTVPALQVLSGKTTDQQAPE